MPTTTDLQREYESIRRTMEALDRVNEDRSILMNGLKRLIDHCAADAGALRIIQETLAALS